MSENNVNRSNCRPLSQQDLMPWESINEKGQLVIDVEKAEKQGYRLTVTRFPIGDDQAEYTQEILPETVQGGKYTAGQTRIAKE